MDNLKWLENWYLSNCNGDWEHSNHLKIVTLDNPGWLIEIDLLGTGVEKQKFESVRHEISNHNWLYCKVENNKFYGYGGPNNLTEIIQIFKNWSSNKFNT